MTVLSDKMRAIKGHPRATELKDLADQLDAASEGFYAEPQTCRVERLAGCWTRARRIYAEVTGEARI